MPRKQSNGTSVTRKVPVKPLSKHNGAKSRRKGHTYERNIVKFFKELGFDRACTSRQGSRLMDDAKIDLCYVPFNVQCKAVEANINYSNLLKEVDTKIKELVPERDEFPILIFHKRKGENLIITDLSNFEKLIKKCYGAIQPKI